MIKSNISKELLTESYNYTLPDKLIASTPVYPRDSAKLLVYNRKDKSITHTTFKYLLDFIPEKCEIFLNDTRVIKARIFGKKKSGGKIELLFNKPLDSFSSLVMIRGRVKVDTILYFDKELTAEVLELNSDGSRIVKFYYQNSPIRFEDLILILDDIGHIPLPPYIKREDKKEDERDYQTLFAKNAGAVASPTASLHFTKELFKELEDKYNLNKITLHVGAGTFKPVETKEILDHPMHSEYFNIPNHSKDIINSNKHILAIGTTVTRTIEYYVREKKVDGECNLFLNPNNPPIRVNHLLTNFHLPKSTLIMLVSSFIGREETLKLYQEAIENNYRFFSYGDSMLIL
ncbi:S-adenosylmethionine:tRNA ribosyltransferase-isomerase [hydrothermal vent metagenome]|uniref:S-adenosylmethionine:tRNA ribosyltransferase-isomerase n=1 Tax=hydrothermal vent metagenome TaxID=652676 RepID=A0A1W1BPB6_9ZZZZ